MYPGCVFIRHGKISDIETIITKEEVCTHRSLRIDALNAKGHLEKDRDGQEPEEE